ncbi:hypothetical protein GM608_00740 [Bombella sp. ESL0380]|uniref:hypothetical protein n=1 Tax=Bombella sp. ESL0380 TaxID=2676444 RepID=UPI00139EAAF1|nr:hypothetical protein [Bombella sp. ESL0380]
MTRNIILHSLEIEPARITALSVQDGCPLSHIDIGWGCPDGVWIDPTEGRIYWTNMGANPSDADGTIESARLDGSDHKVLVANGLVVTPKQLTSTPGGEHLYWCDREGMRIMRCRRDGSDVEVLLQTGTYPEHMKDATRHCVGITLDTSNGHLYWSQKGPPKGGRGRIFRMSLDLPAGTDPADRHGIELLADHLPEPIDLHVSPALGKLWWTDRGAAPDGNSLNVARVDEHGLHDQQVILRDLDEAIGLAVDAEGTLAFVSDLGGSIREVILETGQARLITKQAPTTGLCLVVQED